MLNTPEIHDKPCDARLAVRFYSEQKDFFQRAATLTGHTLSELVMDSTQEVTAKIVQENELIRLSRERTGRFCQRLAGSFRTWRASQEGRATLSPDGGAEMAASPE